MFVYPVVSSLSAAWFLFLFYLHVNLFVRVFFFFFHIRSFLFSFSLFSSINSLPPHTSIPFFFSFFVCTINFLLLLLLLLLRFVFCFFRSAGDECVP